MFTYPYPRMLVTVDAVVFVVDKQNTPTHLLLIERGNDPFKGHYALPGGFPEMDELLVHAAARELQEETGISGLELRQIGAFDDIDRDPRDRNIAIAFWGVIRNAVNPTAGDDAAKAQWFPINQLPPLAFDHAKIVKAALDCLKEWFQTKNGR